MSSTFRRLRTRLTEPFSRLSNLVQSDWRGATIFKAMRLLSEVGAIDLAASLSFFTVISLLPLLALIMTGLIIFGSAQETSDILMAILDYLFPVSQDLIDSAINDFRGGSITIGVVAIINLIIAANGLFAAAHRASNRVFGIKDPRVLQFTIQNVSLVTIFVALLFVSVGLTSGIQVLLRIGQEISVFLVIAIGILSTLVPVIFITAFFTVIYRRLPNTHVTWRDAIFGGLVAIVFFEIGKYLFFLFINQAADRLGIYGPITSVVIFMLSALLVNLIFLYGVAITKVAGDLRPK